MIKLTTVFQIHKAWGEIVEISKTINGNTTVCPIERKNVAMNDGSILVNENALNARKWFFKKIK